MKIISVICGGVLVLLVAISAVLGRLQDRVQDWEGKAAAVQAGLRQVELDGRSLSQTIAEASRRTSSGEKSLLALLDNDQVNQLARQYLGCDFVLMRRELQGQLANVRHLQEKQKEHYTHKNFDNTELGRKIKELERKKSMLSNTALHASRVSEVQWRVQMDDVDEQLSTLRGLENSRRYRNEDAQDVINSAEMQNETRMHTLVISYENASIRRLVSAIAAQESALRRALEDAGSRRIWMRRLDVVPIRWLASLFRAR